MDEKYKKLKTLLMELFQLDQPDLDFGLYRVLHARSAEITQFLDNDLLPQVKASFAQYKPADKAVIEKELAQLIAGIEAAGMNPDDSPKVKELSTRLTDEAVDLDALEADVYDHLYSFFRRYYSEGDFLSNRVYKAGVYAIPYEGEEVKLHWANADQYYIKTSEYLRDYAFRLRPDDVTNPMRVHFRLVDVAEGEHGNLKEQAGKERRFRLATESPVAVEDGELVMRFTYQPDAAKQKDLNASAEQTVLASGDQTLADWIQLLGASHVRADETTSDSTRLRVHLDRYTARNTFDYFIHKDLGGFLRRELDFYIKNEVMHLDDVESESAPRVEQYLSKIKVIRRIAGKIIVFLTQLEDFQKKLWRKKKFVVKTSYSIRLAIIPEKFYPVIRENKAQRDEWLGLGTVDQMEAMDAPSSSLLDAAFFESRPTLMMDTRHFEDSFVETLLDSIQNVGGDGIAFHGENFQALSLMQRTYQDSVRVVYIDPPYNTAASAIDYKNGYKASSWMSMIEGRLAVSKELLQSNGILVAAIDDEQQRELSFVLGQVFDGRLLGTIVVRSNPSGRPTQTGYSVSHEYLMFAAKSSNASIGRLRPTDEQMARFSERDETGPFEWRNLRREGSNSDRSARRALFYPIYLLDSSLRVPAMKWNANDEEWIIEEAASPNEQVVWPTNEDGVEKTWRWEGATVMESLSDLEVRPDRSGRDYVYYKRRPHEEGVVSVSSWFDAKYSSTEHGTALLKDLFGRTPFSYPKSIYAVTDAILIAGASDVASTVCDYFGGSGTTAHSVINLNRADGGSRRFLIVEQESYFDTVLVPRLKKVIYTPEWKNGKPTRSATAEEADRSPRVIKVVRLESYEDALNNLEINRTAQQQATLDLSSAKGSVSLKEQYMLRYMLDVETRGSQSLLNVSAFIDPTAYKLKVKRPGSDESREVNVDLLETFNWLIGLKADHIAAPRTVSASFKRDGDPDLPTDSLRRLLLDGDLAEDANGPWWFRTVIGNTPDGLKTLIIWRKRPGGDSPEGVEQDNLVLNEWFTKQRYASDDHDFDLVYVNSGNNLEMLKSSTDKWTARIIEDDFHRLMFESDEV